MEEKYRKTLEALLNQVIKRDEKIAKLIDELNVLKIASNK